MSKASKKYAIVTCRSRHTLVIAKALYVEYDINAWAPKTVKKKPKSGEKYFAPAFPGFVFIPERDLEEAEKASKSLLIPQFSVMIKNEKQCTCTEGELDVFEQALSEANKPFTPTARIKVGDEVTVKQGPLKDVKGLVTEIRIENTVMVSVETETGLKIGLPASLVG